MAVYFFGLGALAWGPERRGEIVLPFSLLAAEQQLPPSPTAWLVIVLCCSVV